MTESDRDLIRHLTESVQEQGKSLYQVHGVVSSVHERQEALSHTISQLVHAVNARADEADERADIHSARINETASTIAAWTAQGIHITTAETAKQIEAWKAQARLIVWVAGLVGLGGFVSTVSVLAKLSGH